MTLSSTPSSASLQKVRLGTRGSPLALAQTRMVAERLMRAHPGLEVEVVEITTSGDRIQDRALAAIGGKGLFTKEIEDALLNKRIDAAVHSMKDVPTWLPQGLTIACVLPRDDPRDVWICTQTHADGTPLGIVDLPAGSLVGTSSLRRQALILAARPDLRVDIFRGNVGTRLQKLAAGVADATLLAKAGLDRLGVTPPQARVLTIDEMLPAAAQGIIGVEIRADDHALSAALAACSCAQTELALTAERAFLDVMDGSCRTPIAAHMQPADPEGRARFDVLVARPDGSEVVRDSYLMEVRHRGDAERLGRHAGEVMRAKLPPDFIAACEVFANQKI